MHRLTPELDYIEVIKLADLKKKTMIFTYVLKTLEGRFLITCSHQD